MLHSDSTFMFVTSHLIGCHYKTHAHAHTHTCHKHDEKHHVIMDVCMTLLLDSRHAVVGSVRFFFVVLWSFFFFFFFGSIPSMFPRAERRRRSLNVQHPDTAGNAIFYSFHLDLVPLPVSDLHSALTCLSFLCFPHFSLSVLFRGPKDGPAWASFDFARKRWTLSRRYFSADC